MPGSSRSSIPSSLISVSIELSLARNRHCHFWIIVGCRYDEYVRLMGAYRYSAQRINLSVEAYKFVATTKLNRVIAEYVSSKPNLVYRQLTYFLKPIFVNYTTQSIIYTVSDLFIHTTSSRICGLNHKSGFIELSSDPSCITAPDYCPKQTSTRLNEVDNEIDVNIQKS